MDLYSLIRNVSMIVWLLPPIRQYGGKYFIYFLILAMADPLAAFLNQLIGANAGLLTILLHFLLLFTFIKHSASVKTNLMMIAAMLILATILSFETYHYKFAAYLVLHSTIIFIILKNSLIEIFSEKELNIFPFILILYESVFVTRIIAILSEFTTGEVFFYLSGVFQLLIAIFFILFRDDDKKLIIKLRS